MIRVKWSSFVVNRMQKSFICTCFKKKMKKYMFAFLSFCQEFYYLQKVCNIS